MNDPAAESPSEIAGVARPERKPVSGATRALVLFLDRAVLGLSRRWLAVFNSAVAVFLLLPAVAPLLAAQGRLDLAQPIYVAYGLTCHQLPERSYFLFGPNRLVDTYGLDVLIAQGADPGNLRAFIGTPELGYKLALAQRCMAIYPAILLGGLAFGLVRRRLQPLPIGWYLLLIAPMFFDGVSHMITDVTGWGWRSMNGWALAITGGIFGPAFYQGSTLGTLNWLLRTVTGALFGFASVWLVYPYLETAFAEIREQASAQLAKAASREENPTQQEA